MTAVELPNNPWEARSLPPWRDLIFYLLFGLGGRLLASLAVEFLVNPGEMTLRLSLIDYLLDLIFIGGSVLLLSSWRKQLDLTAIGFIPPRITTKLVNLAVAAWLVSIPAQFAAGVTADLVTGGSWHSSGTLLELIAPDGFPSPCTLHPIVWRFAFSMPSWRSPPGCFHANANLHSLASHGLWRSGTGAKRRWPD